MSNYNKATNFAVKDTLTSGDPDKVVSGAEIDNEFNSIASAVTSKADKVASATTNNIATLDANGNLKDGGASVISVAPPVGSVTMYAASNAPTGWLECDGSNVSRTTYSNLFSAIGTTFGEGDGSTTFNLPDLRGEFVRGWDNNRGVDSGRSLGSAQSDEVKEHNHGDGILGQNTLQTNARTGVDVVVVEKSTGSIQPFGGPETRPRNIALMYIIKT